MVARADVIINWVVSPRIITVLSPSVEITIQDLLDTCREAEDDLPNIVYSQIASAAGKENLGGGVRVGVTLTLLNAVLAFEARPGPTYTQCRVSGGNLVAIDSGGLDISPIFPTAFTQILTTSSSSATLQESADIQYASFNGRVSVDLDSPYSGTAFPNGTPRQYVNNFADALAIANSRGIERIHIDGTATIDSGLDYSGKAFVGESVTKTFITVDPAAQIIGCEFYDMTIGGTLDGGSIIDNCIINDITYTDGFIKNSTLNGTITLSGANPMFILNCSDGMAGSGTPIIDCAGAGSSLNIRGFRGGITIRNKTGSDEVSIDGDIRVILENTVTNGSFIIRGTGKVTNNSTGTTTVDTSTLLNQALISSAIWNEPKSNYTTPGSLGKEIATKKDVISTAVVFK